MLTLCLNVMTKFLRKCCQYDWIVFNRLTKTIVLHSLNRLFYATCPIATLCNEFYTNFIKGFHLLIFIKHQPECSIGQQLRMFQTIKDTVYQKMKLYGLINKIKDSKNAIFLHVLKVYWICGERFSLWIFRLVWTEFTCPSKFSLKIQRENLSPQIQ